MATQVQSSVAERLEALGARRMLIDMAVNRQILRLRCEMPTCYHPDSRQHFDPWPASRQSPESGWHVHSTEGPGRGSRRDDPASVIIGLGGGSNPTPGTKPKAV